MNYTILDFVITVASLVIITFLVPVLKKYRTKTEWEQILINAQIAVNAAEQIFDWGDNEKKYNYVDKILKNMFGDKLSTSERKMVIESVITEMNEFKNELVK